MASRALLALAVLAAPAASLEGGSSSDISEAASAANWLELRAQSLEALKQPQQDELEQVRASDPNAYAAVKALLAKQALGVLNPRHPSAGFADEGTHLSAEGAASLARMEAEVVKKKAPPQDDEDRAAKLPQSPYAEAGAAQHDWSHFKPEDTDDQIVASLGGDGGSLLSEAQQVAPEVVADDPEPVAPSVNIGGMYIPKIDWGASRNRRAPKPAPAAVARAQAPRPQPAMNQQSSWLSQTAIDFGSFIPETEKPSAPARATRPTAAMTQADSELAGFDLKNDLVRRAPRPVRRTAAAAPPAAPPVMNALTQFDWNTAASEEQSTTEKNTYLRAADLHASQQAQPVPDHVNPYLAMMGEDDKADASLLSSRAETYSSRTELPGRRGQSNGYLRAINFQNARQTHGILGTFEADLEG